MKKESILAPIIVVVILLGYYLAFFFYFIYFLPNIWVKLAIGIIPLIISIIFISVLIERIKEIRSDELDDLSKY